MPTYSLTTQRALLRLDQLTRANESKAEGLRKFAASPVRHKVFVSYHAADAVEVLQFIEKYDDVFIARAIGMEEDGSDIIDSTNVEYIRRTIREKYLKDSTVTLVLVGACTWARKFVDWEIYSSLRSNPSPNGLLAVQLPSTPTGTKAPARLELNRPSQGGGYARYYLAPSGAEDLRANIQVAFEARTTKRDLIDLGGDLRKRNASC
ncbi:TIR domain-containing protein [Curtobacterium flaccumfaciens pv. flaccumfaciens]|nr:TIR domain-containing protein [Curtobacterium flaccumfaciens pv. flaccumfaciens]